MKEMRGIMYVEYRDIISDKVEYYLCISVAGDGFQIIMIIGRINRRRRSREWIRRIIREEN